MAKTKKAKIEVRIQEEKKADVVPTRGRVFQGTVTRKFPKRVVIEFERTVYVQKYKSFYKKKTRLHARLPDSMQGQINIGDYIRVQECRPLSKIIHFVVREKIRSAEQNIGGNQK